MTLFILEEFGHALSESCVHGLVKEFIRTEKLKRVDTVLNLDAENDLLNSPWPADMVIVFVWRGKPFLLGANDVAKLHAKITAERATKKRRFCRELLCDIMVEGGYST